MAAPAGSDSGPRDQQVMTAQVTTAASQEPEQGRAKIGWRNDGAGLCEATAAQWGGEILPSLRYSSGVGIASLLPGSPSSRRQRDNGFFIRGLASPTATRGVELKRCADCSTVDAAFG